MTPLATLAGGLLLAAVAADPCGIGFRDRAEAWGLTFRHHHGGSGERYMPETLIGGVVILDYDDDGDEDVFFVDGGELPGYRGEPPRSVLYRNDGGRFVDVTATAGIVVAGYGAGATAGDVDGDGDLDLYVTAVGPNQLLVNAGDGTFRPLPGAGGADDPSFSASAAFADVDLDGDLDLYVTNYVDFTLDNHRFCGDRERNLRAYCSPAAYSGLPDRFYRNRGDGTFEDATAAAGFANARGAGLGVAFGDLDDDGWPDLYVANDADPNYLFRNRGDGTFEDLSLVSGTAYNDRGQPEGGMGVDLSDYDGDGRLDIVETNSELETNGLYRNLGGNLFLDERFVARLAEGSLLKVAFGVAFADLDLDGDLDLVIANGHILDNAELFNLKNQYAQPNQVFENRGGGRFAEVAAHGIDQVRPSRGLALGDLDGDGDLDVVINNSNQPAEVYENLCDTAAGLGVDLWRPRGDRFAVGARLELVAAGRRQVREVRTGSSYLSQHAMTVRFGLGAAGGADALVVRWPGGGRLRLLAPPAGRRLRIVEP